MVINYSKEINMAHNLAIKKFLFNEKLNNFWIGFSSWTISFTIWSPSFTYYIYTPGGRRKELLMQCSDPFRKDVSYYVHSRILHPLISNLFGLCSTEFNSLRSLISAPGIAFISSIILLTLISGFLKKYNSKFIAIFGCLLIASSSIIQWSNWVWGTPDSIALLLIGIILLIRNKFCMSLLLLAGSLCDERIFLSVPSIIFFKFAIDSNFFENKNFNLLKFIRPFVLPFLFSFLIFLIFKIFLVREALTDMDMNEGVISHSQTFLSYFNRLFNPKKYLDLIWLFFNGFRWGWVLIFISYYQMLKQKKIYETFFYLFSLLICFVPILIVADVSRSIAFIFPLLLFAISYLDNKNSIIRKVSIKKLLFILLFLNILTPSGITSKLPGFPESLVYIDNFYIQYPLPIRIWRFIIYKN